MRANSVGFAAVLLLAVSPTLQAQRSAAPAARFELTVDSIMRGPDLVGYPPSGLRWSADSQNLYFEWRQISEDKASTYVVGRTGGSPRRLGEDEAKKVPPATGGRWDKGRRRVLFVDGGDIVMVDAVAGTRRQITRTTGGESNPRWARNDTHVTWTREGNLFIAPLEGGGPELLTQLTDVSQRRPDPRLTDSQRFIRDEEEKLIDFIEKQKADKKKAEDEQKKGHCRTSSSRIGSMAADLMLSPDGTHVFIVVAERAVGMKPTIVPNYVTETGYTKDITGRTNVGDVQDRRMLAVLNLQTGKSVWADGSFAPPPPADKTDKEDKPSATAAGGGPQARPSRPAERDIRWSMPAVSDDGKLVVATARSADNKDRWHVVLDPETGKSRVVDLLHDDAWVREAGGGGGGGGGFGGPSVAFLPDNKRIWFLSERDGWMHLYTLDVAADGARPVQLTSGKWEVSAAELSRDGKKFYVTTSEVHPGERHLYTMSLEGGARTKVTGMPGSNEARSLLTTRRWASYFRTATNRRKSS